MSGAARAAPTPLGLARGRPRSATSDRRSQPVERSLLMARGSRIEAADLGLRRREDGTVLMDELTLDEAERLLVEKALDRYQGNVSKAADALGLSRSALYRRLQRFEEEDE